jgi:hypothetical protein
MRRATFPSACTSVASARDLVGQACVEWGFTRILYAARAVVSEIVMNAVDHTDDGFTLTVSRRAPLLHLAVEDRDVELPGIPADRAGAHPPLADRGRGLRRVAERANAWGASACPGGKVVWATMSAATPPSTVAR